MDSTELNLNFYKQIKPIDNIEYLTDLSRYQSCPDDWMLVLTDIKGSTLAVENGRQKDVNLMGAAAIAAFQNIVGTRDIPFTFGGDGATFVLPRAYYNLIRQELIRLKNHSLENFKLDLRSSIIPVIDIKEQNGSILLGRYKLSENNYMALLAGDGFLVAEKILKKESTKYQIHFDEQNSTEIEAPNLDNLSCRWDLIPSQKGVIISLLALAQDEQRQSEIYQKVLKNTFQTNEKSRFSQSPLKPVSFLSQLKTEMMIHSHRFGFKKFLMFLINYVFVTYTLLTGKKLSQKIDIEGYIQETMNNSDFRKMDYCLKMVIDCSLQEKAKIVAFLEDCFQRGELYYGLHISDSALMTCVVHEISNNQHIHFIDGNNGGYTFAAKELKKQMSLKIKS